MGESIITHLALRLGVDPHEAEAAYNALAARVRDHLKAGHPYHVPQLGTFILKDGNVTFHPDAALSEAVNHRFEHMDAIVVGEAKPPAKDLSVDDDLPLEEETPTDSPTLGTVEQPPQQPEGTLKIVSDEPSAETPDLPPSSPKDNLAESPPPPRPRRRIHRTVPKKKESNAGIWTMIIVTLLFAVGATVFVVAFDGSLESFRAWATGTSTDTTPPPSASPTPADPTSSAPGVADVAPADSLASTLSDSTTSFSADSTIVADSLTALPANDQPTPLASPQIVTENGGYSLVVGAFASNADAEQLRDQIRRRLEEQPYPVDIVPAAPGVSRFRYRVCVGQFDSPDEARDTHRALSGILPDDAWVLNLSR